jgi:hypothetical protein
VNTGHAVASNTGAHSLGADDVPRSVEFLERHLQGLSTEVG